MANEIEDLNAEIERLQQDAIDERDELEKDLSTDEDNEENENDDSGDENENENEDSADTDDDDMDDSNNEESEDNEKDENSDDDEVEKQSADNLDFKPISINVDNTKITLDSKEEVEKYIANQNRNMSNVKYSEIEETVSQAKLTKDDLALLADIKAGNIGALKTLAIQAKLDLADAEDFDGEYKTQFEPKIKTDVDLVVDNISKDSELVEKFTEVISEVPQDFIDIVSANAGDLQQFAQHVKSGLAQELIPLAKKESILNGGSLLENYIKLGEAKVAKEKSSKDTNKKKDKDSNKREISEKEKRLRRRAGADNDENRGGSSSSLSVDDIWNMSPEDRKNIDLRDLA